MPTDGEVAKFTIQARLGKKNLLLRPLEGSIALAFPTKRAGQIVPEQSKMPMVSPRIGGALMPDVESG